MSLPEGSKARLAALIGGLPARQGLSAAVPAAALLDVLEITGGIARHLGDGEAAAELEGLGRLLRAEPSALLQAPGPPAHQPVEAPAKRRFKAPVLRLRT